MTVSPAGSPHRVVSLDIIRGAVMVLMALDHVRVYAGVPAGGPDPAVFFTRWVTHFCAPAFFFLAGTGAFLHLRRVGDRGALARFLVSRGLWLVLLELTLIRIAWTFNLDYATFLLGGVIWALGWCMVLLAALVFLPVRVVGAIGVGIIAAHNLLPQTPSTWLWQVLYSGGPITLRPNGPDFFVLYSIVPWIGVMAAGYAFGTVMVMDADRRRRVCLQIGFACIALFAILRGFNLYGNPQPWDGSELPAVLSFLNTAKYPASLLFLLMTLGPTILVIPLLERAHGRVARWLATFGRVPFFFYLLHIPLIHAVAVFISTIRTPTMTWWLFTNHPVYVPPAPPGYTWSLPLLYLVTALVVIALYFPCRRFAAAKAHRKSGLLSYL